MNDDAILKLVKLREIAEINPKHTISLEKNTLISFVAMSAVSAETASTIAEERYYGEVSKGYTPFVNGDILVAKITPCFENGKIAQAKLPNHIGFGSTEFHVVRPRLNRIDTRYLLHFLRQESIRRDGARKMTGSAGQRRVPQNFLANLEIRLPPLKEQQRIAEILDRAESLRAKRREAIAQLDTLTQSIFLEMFGDPVANTKNIKTISLAKVCKRITDGTHQPPKWATSGYPFLFVSNIISGEIDFNTTKFISAETHEELTRRCPIEVGDILYSTVGSYGVPVIVKSQCKFAFQRHISHIKPDSNLINSQFLCAMLASPPLKRQADRTARGVAQKTVNLEEIRKFTIFHPSLDIQEEFAHRIEVIEKLKASHRTSLAELDALFASLQHHAFRGEL